MVQIESLRKELQELEGRIVAGVHAAMDERGVGGDDYLDGRRILEEMRKFHSVVESRLSTMASLSLPHGHNVDVHGDAFEVHDDGGNDSQPIVVVRDNFRYNFRFDGDGRIRRLPTGFVFPYMTLASLINCWYVGNVAEKTIPFGNIVPMELSTLRLRKDFSSMKQLMKVVEKAARLVGAWPRLRWSQWSAAYTTALYDRVKHMFVYKTTSGRKRRHYELSWQTIVKLHRKHGFANETS